MSIRTRVAAATLLAAVGTATALLAPAAAANAATAPPSTSSSTSSSTPSATAKACDKTAWEAKVQGRPTFHAGAASGQYLWHDSTGFHLRVTHRGNEKIVYSGQVSASAPMRLDKVKLEGKDFATLSADRKVLTYRFYNFGHVDGVNFHTDCATALKVRFLHANGHAMSLTRVYLGATSAHPAKVPFVVHRKVAAA